MRLTALGALALLLALPASAQSTERVIHRYTDEVKTAEGVQTRYVAVVVDPDTGDTSEVIYSAAGDELSRRPLRPAPPNEAEMEQARRIIAEDPELSALARSRPVHVDGGYILLEAEGALCGPGSRCLHMDMLDAEDRRQRVRFVVVDLVSQRVVYPDFDPDEHGRMH